MELRAVAFRIQTLVLNKSFEAHLSNLTALEGSRELEYVVTFQYVMPFKLASNALFFEIPAISPLRFLS